MKSELKILGSYIDNNQITALKELIGKKIWFARTASLEANLSENIYTASAVQIPFFWKDEFGNLQSKEFDCRSQWIEDDETYLDHYVLEISISDRDKSTNFNNSVNQFIEKGWNSSISFNEFHIHQIKIL